MSQFVPLFHSCRGARDFSLSNRGQFSLLMPTLRNKMSHSHLRIKDVSTQVAQARNISIGEHRHCCITFEIHCIRICMEKNPSFS